MLAEDSRSDNEGSEPRFAEKKPVTKRESENVQKPGYELPEDSNITSEIAKAE